MRDLTKIDGFPLTAVDDSPDLRDWRYSPALVQLAAEKTPPPGLKILNQGKEGTCTGFGLAAVINLLNSQRGVEQAVSARMLYEMAKMHDEWEGEDYSGSSCRGTIKGWHTMGVCSEESWVYEVNKPGQLTVDRAKEARAHTMGAYYRIDKRLPDFHAALNEVDAIFVSARVHGGWSKRKTKNGRIPFEMGSTGGHAFAIVGYNNEGFWVQNSWGDGWGDDGIALWAYEDWLENIRDAWVVRMGLSTPQVWHLEPVGGATGVVSADDEKKPSPKRAEIAGHFVHIDDGRFHPTGTYWSCLADVEITAAHVGPSDKYKHLLFYAHGGLNSVKASARRVAAMKEVFKDNGVYPYHFMYDTGLCEEIKDVVLGKSKKAEERAGAATDLSDWVIEKLTRVPGRAVWREIKRGAKSPFGEPDEDGERDNAGTRTLQAFLAALDDAPDDRKKKIHVVGHSTGAILLAYLIEALLRLDPDRKVETCALMAPAATVDLFKSHYSPLIKLGAGNRIGRTAIYNLNKRLEKDDTVTPAYRKSLLYLVSRAFEEDIVAPLAGMKKYANLIRFAPNTRFNFFYSDGTATSKTRTASTEHGGFDNDRHTMNDILKRIVGSSNVVREFTDDDLEY
jgi:pimeloyl-ACP methyl ester carboxylesterase